MFMHVFSCYSPDFSSADEASAEEWVNEVEMRQKRAVEGEADAQKEENGFFHYLFKY